MEFCVLVFTQAGCYVNTDLICATRPGRRKTNGNFEVSLRAGEVCRVLPYIKFIWRFEGCQVQILLFCHIVSLSYVVEYYRNVILYFGRILFLRAEERKRFYYGVIC